jgi:hypothetical protein
VQTYLAQHYHQPSDVVRDDWDLRGAVDQGRFCFDLGWKLSLQRDIPHWLPGDEFEEIRRQSFVR